MADAGVPDPSLTAQEAVLRARGRRWARPYRPRHRRLRRWPRRILVLVNALVFVMIAAAATVVGYTSYELGSITRIHVPGLARPTRPVPSVKGVRRTIRPFTVLIVGSDTRALKGTVGGIGNPTTNSENLGDSIILARVDPSAHKLALLSIPRDLYVDIPGTGIAKINSAFSASHPDRLVDVISDQLGIPIDHYAAVNFYSFEQIADAIGGVEQYFPTPAFDIESGLQVPAAGCVALKGAQALAFVRSRNYYYVRDGPQLQQYPESDLGRIQRQQAFIKAAIKKVERNGDLTDPLTITRIISSVTANLTIDNTFSDNQLITLADDFRRLDANAIPNLTYPVVNDGAGLDRVPTADAATVAEFENLGAPAPSATTTRPAGSAPTTATPTATPTTAAPTTSSSVPATTTTVPAQGNSYSSGTQIEPDASSYFDGVYIPPGRVPGQQVQTCGD